MKKLNEIREKYFELFDKHFFDLIEIDNISKYPDFKNEMLEFIEQSIKESLESVMLKDLIITNNIEFKNGYKTAKINIKQNIQEFLKGGNND
jgi:hypothetical protein